MDTVSERTYTVRMREERICVGDRISWKRVGDRVRVFGEVTQIMNGFYVAVSDRGVPCALRRRDVTKECG